MLLFLFLIIIYLKNYFIFVTVQHMYQSAKELTFYVGRDLVRRPSSGKRQSWTQELVLSHKIILTTLWFLNVLCIV